MTECGRRRLDRPSAQSNRRQWGSEERKRKGFHRRSDAGSDAAQAENELKECDSSHSFSCPPHPHPHHPQPNPTRPAERHKQRWPSLADPPRVCHRCWNQLRFIKTSFNGSLTCTRPSAVSYWGGGGAEKGGGGGRCHWGADNKCFTPANGIALAQSGWGKCVIISPGRGSKHGYWVFMGSLASSATQWAKNKTNKNNVAVPHCVRVLLSLKT